MADVDISSNSGVFLMIIADENISVEFDDRTGCTTRISDPLDGTGMNWVLPQSYWGRIEEFDIAGVQIPDITGVNILCDGVAVEGENSREHLSIRITRRVENGVYTECYSLRNNGPLEYFINREKFGIHFPHNCDFSARNPDGACVNHVWCGGDETWICSAKPSGKGRFLYVAAVEGAFSDFSVDIDGSRTNNGSHYRGAIVLHPAPYVIKPGETKRYLFNIEFSESRPEERLICPIRARANKYTVYPAEKINCFFETAFDWDRAEIRVGNMVTEFTRCGHRLTADPLPDSASASPHRIKSVTHNNSAPATDCEALADLAECQNNKMCWTLAFYQPGEREVRIKAGDKTAVMRVNVIEHPDAILARRAHFICEKQQYRAPGSHLYGAYLIYDHDSGSQYFSSTFRDSNSARERLSMGCIVLKELQHQAPPDQELLESIRLHRAYVERELFIADTATVCDSAPLSDSFKRAYNYPWMADYYLEWFKYSGESICLETSARILIRYFELIGGTTQASPGLDVLEVWRAAKKNGLSSLADKLSRTFIAHANLILQSTFSFHSQEVSCTQTQFAVKLLDLCHAYLISGDSKYLAPKDTLLTAVKAMRSYQPDFHVNTMDVRYWDLFWFGGMKTFGDTSPQWVSVMTARLYRALAECGDKSHLDEADRIERNSLCLFKADGFAASSYLVPYSVRQHFSGKPQNTNAEPKKTFGKRYDNWANDQDWILYYQDNLFEE